jgi:hypothetical protein
MCKFVAFCLIVSLITCSEPIEANDLDVFTFEEFTMEYQLPVIIKTPSKETIEQTCDMFK